MRRAVLNGPFPGQERVVLLPQQLPLVRVPKPVKLHLCLHEPVCPPSVPVELRYDEYRLVGKSEGRTEAERTLFYDLVI